MDPTGNGLRDLNNDIFAFNDDAQERINEDSLRVYRAYRFLSYGFEPAQGLLKCVRLNFNFAQRNTSSERVRQELEKMISYKE